VRTDGTAGVYILGFVFSKVNVADLEQQNAFFFTKDSMLVN